MEFRGREGFFGVIFGLGFKMEGRTRERSCTITPNPHGNILSGDIPITPDRAVEFRESSKKESI